MSSTPSIAPSSPTFNRTHVGRALRHLRLEVQDEPADLNAVNRAALNLEACRWQFSGRRLRVESASSPGARFYTVTEDGCSCPSGVPASACWHKAAFAILTIAQTLAAAEATLAERQAAVDELFG